MKSNINKKAKNFNNLLLLNNNSLIIKLKLKKKFLSKGNFINLMD